MVRSLHSGEAGQILEDMNNSKHTHPWLGKGAQRWMNETVPSNAFAAVGQSWEVWTFIEHRAWNRRGSTPHLSMVKWLRSDLRVGCWGQMGHGAHWPLPSLLPSSTVYKGKMSSIFLHTNDKGNVFLLFILWCTDRRNSEHKSHRASGLCCRPGTGLERFLFIVLISLSVLS